MNFDKNLPMRLKQILKPYDIELAFNEEELRNDKMEE